MSAASILILLVGIIFFIIFFINFVIFFVCLLMYEHKGGFSPFNVLGMIFNLDPQLAKDRKILKYRKRMLTYGGLSILLLIISAYNLRG